MTTPIPPPLIAILLWKRDMKLLKMIGPPARRVALQLVLCVACLASAVADDGRNVILVTIDGLRWQELFGGADERLIADDAGVKDIAATQQRFVRQGREASRAALMPFFWSVIAAQGIVYGDPDQQSAATLTNSYHFSYPGYNEILTGQSDPKVDSNAKRYNENVTVLEWLNQQPELNGRVAAMCSWDVFPYIINTRRSGVVVNAGWQPTADLLDANDPAMSTARDQLLELDRIADQMPRLWPGVRFDYFTFKAAQIYTMAKHPRVLYLSLGEVDDWAHEGRYDLYLDSIQRSDGHLRELWETIQAIPQYRDRTTLIVTTDHGRGDGRGDWKSHSAKIPGCDTIWIAMMGPGVPHAVATGSRVTQAQVASTVAAALGYDFRRDAPAAAPPLPTDF